MKRKTSLVILLLGLLHFSLYASQHTGVTMIKFDQSCYDINSTISLRNQTDSLIYGLKFQLVYYDMNNQQIDYKTFTINESIQPKMARIFQIPAFQPHNNYYYYRSDGYQIGTKFKVDFKLLKIQTQPHNLQFTNDLSSEDTDDLKSENNDYSSIFLAK